jgi:hypothetical protein
VLTQGCSLQQVHETSSAAALFGTADSTSCCCYCHQTQCEVVFLKHARHLKVMLQGQLA